MRRISLGLVGISALVVAPFAIAHAADMPLKAPPMVAPPPAYNWSGIYIGINGGMGWGFLDQTDDFNSSFLAPSTVTHFGAWGGQIGGQGGIRWQFGQFVIGAEVSGDWADINDSVTQGPNVAHLRINDQFAATGQIGWVWHDVLFYWKGGGIWADVDQIVDNGLTGAHGTNSQTASGWIWGTGMELPVPAIPGLSAGLEFDYAQLGYSGFIAQVPPFNPYIVFNTSHLTLESLLLRINYKFNAWAPGPVVTRY